MPLLDSFKVDHTKMKAPGVRLAKVMQTPKGEFSFTMPLTGWWGFAALIEDDETIKKDGKDYPIELGGVIWVETKDYIK